MKISPSSLSLSSVLRSLLAYNLLAVISLLTLGGIALVLQFQSIDSTSKEQLQQPLTDTRGGQFVSAANAHLASTTELISAIAARTETQKAVVNPPVQWAESIRPFIPGATHVSLINRVQLRGLQEEHGFAILDIASRAFKQGDVSMEAIYRNGEQRLYIAAPVNGFNQQKGVLLVEFSKDWLMRFDSAAEQLAGTIILQQPDTHIGASGNIDIHRWGSGRYLPNDLTRFTLSNGWTADIAADTQSIALDAINIILPSAIVMMVALLVVSALLLLMTQRVNRDHVNLMAYLHSVHRQKPQPGQYHFMLFERMAYDLEALLVARAPVIKAASEYDNNDREPQSIPMGKPSVLQHSTVSGTESGGPRRFSRHVPDKGIFRAYDIRGLVNSQLTETTLYWIGRAVAAEITSLGHDRIALGWDGRHSSPTLAAAAEQGLVEGGCRVLVLGEVPTGALYYATHETQAPSGMMITGSHNPPEYNGVKLVFNREAQSGDQLLKLYQRIQQHELPSGRGSRDTLDIGNDYLRRIESDVHISRDLNVVIDAGNGVAGPFAERLSEMLELNITPLYCDVDGDFPNHPPDPTVPDNLKDLITIVNSTGADLGLALDGDGDRVILVDNKGNIVWPDTTLMLLCDGLLQQHIGRSVIYDVKSTRHLRPHIRKLGGKPVVAPTGHSLMKASMKEHHALIGAEFSGHYYFSDRWYGFDDGLYAAARILERLANSDLPVDEQIQQLPREMTTPEISIDCPDEKKFDIITALTNDNILKQGTRLITIDGLRLETRESWGLIRASNTTPRLTVRLAANTASEMANMQQRLTTALKNIDTDLGHQLETALPLPAPAE